MAVAEGVLEGGRACWATMDSSRLLGRAQAEGLMVFAQDSRLVVRGPESAGQDLVQELLRRKTELMPLVPVLGPDERERFEERAAIAEYDGGLTQLEAEWLAWEEFLARRA